MRTKHPLTTSWLKVVNVVVNVSLLLAHLLLLLDLLIHNIFRKCLVFGVANCRRQCGVWLILPDLIGSYVSGLLAGCSYAGCFIFVCGLLTIFRERAAYFS